MVSLVNSWQFPLSTELIKRCYVCYIECVGDTENSCTFKKWSCKDKDFAYPLKKSHDLWRHFRCRSYPVVAVEDESLS